MKEQNEKNDAQFNEETTEMVTRRRNGTSSDNAVFNYRTYHARNEIHRLETSFDKVAAVALQVLRKLLEDNKPKLSQMDKKVTKSLN